MDDGAINEKYYIFTVSEDDDCYCYNCIASRSKYPRHALYDFKSINKMGRLIPEPCHCHQPLAKWEKLSDEEYLQYIMEN
jgi:hypothetical protein